MLMLLCLGGVKFTYMRPEQADAFTLGRVASLFVFETTSSGSLSDQITIHLEWVFEGIYTGFLQLNYTMSKDEVTRCETP